MTIDEEFGEHVCPVCGTDCQSVSEMLDKARAKHAKLVAALKAIESGNMDRIWCALKAREALR